MDTSMKILVAIDGSPCSDAVVTEVRRMPLSAGNILRVITVDPPIEASFLKGAPTVFDEVMKQKSADAHRVVREAAASIQQSVPHVSVESRVIQGWPKEAILDEAEQWGADLIVVGSHGYGTVKRFFLGSISMTVAMNATCSVLIVRPFSRAPVSISCTSRSESSGVIELA